MIIWSGYGYLVLVFAFGVSLVTEFVTELAAGDDQFYQREVWPFPLALFIAGALCWFVGRRLHARGSRRMMDLDTGEEFVYTPADDTFFFVKVQWWALILHLIAVATLVV